MRTTPDALSRSFRRSKLPVPSAATGAVRRRVTIVDSGTTWIASRQTMLPSRTMRFCTPVVLALLTLAAGCQGPGGAVSVRWRVVDLSTSESFDPSGSEAATNDGSCCRQPHPAGLCDFSAEWVVRDVSITLRDPTTGELVLAGEPFKCSTREKTTRFVLPTGTFAIGLDAAVFDGHGAPVPVYLPPPEVRTIVRAEVVNLQIIEVGVHPLPQLPHQGSMVTF
jgi:hypothetical protein